MALYSDRAMRIDSENAFKIGPQIRKLEESGREIVKCNIGEPDFPVPGFIKEEVKRQIDLDNTHYCDPQGIPALRATIAKQISDTRGIKAEAERVVVFPGGKPPIGLCQQTYCGPGDEVVYPSPGFPIYESFVPYVGATPVPLHLREENEFSLSGEQLASVLTKRTKLIFLNFPSNPTGGVASPEQLAEIAAVIRSRCSGDVRIYSDEIYEHILFDGHVHHSIASCPGMERDTIIVSGASKSFAWTGGRIGWALFPTREEAEVFKNLNINYFSCTAAYNQEGVRLGLESPEGPVAIRKMVEIFQLRRNLVVDGLNGIPGIRCLKPKGTFYVFPNVEGACRYLGILKAFAGLPEAIRGKTSPSTLFQMFLLYVHGVATMDRKSFGRIGAEPFHYLRLSIATGTEELKKGVARIAAGAVDRDGFKRFFDAGEHLF
ncbi:MAG: aminotransferase class I/II-fold pyridoxal phosphate-dependent enzyme [Deltaproteobacteria bacterium]|nr:aminotransferase class I/II-fold pyridoxal phosphate-dependent enzyme [Deltaproteobacteria bacterium]